MNFSLEQEQVCRNLGQHNPNINSRTRTFGSGFGQKDQRNSRTTQISSPKQQQEQHN